MNKDEVDRQHLETNVHIPAKWDQGRLVLRSGDALPPIANGSSIELRMKTTCLLNEDDRMAWAMERQSPFLVKGAELFVKVARKNVPEALENQLEEIFLESQPSARFVKVLLEEDLRLFGVRGKPAKLSNCQCRIPALDTQVESVNEAYKVVASAFEPKRRSAAGNVFDLVYTEQRGQLVKLGRLRSTLMGDDRP